MCIAPLARLPVACLHGGTDRGYPRRYTLSGIGRDGQRVKDGEVHGYRHTRTGGARRRCRSTTNRRLLCRDVHSRGTRNGVERGTAKAFFRNKHHALYLRTPYGNQLVIPEPLRVSVDLTRSASCSPHTHARAWSDGRGRRRRTATSPRSRRIGAPPRLSSPGRSRPHGPVRVRDRPIGCHHARISSGRFESRVRGM